MRKRRVCRNDRPTCARASQGRQSMSVGAQQHMGSGRWAGLLSRLRSGACPSSATAMAMAMLWLWPSAQVSRYQVSRSHIHPRHRRKWGARQIPFAHVLTPSNPTTPTQPHRRRRHSPRLTQTPTITSAVGRNTTAPCRLPRIRRPTRYMIQHYNPIYQL
jgi:hypothetical protein